MTFSEHGEAFAVTRRPRTGTRRRNGALSRAGNARLSRDDARFAIAASAPCGERAAARRFDLGRERSSRSGQRHLRVPSEMLNAFNAPYFNTVQPIIT